MNYYEKAREFSKKYVEPYAKDVDENKRFPIESFKKLSEEGYFGLFVPKKYGGEGLTIKEHTDIVRGISESCATVGLCYMMHNEAIRNLVNFGSEELKEEIFGNIVKNGAFVALAYSEFGTGTHFYFTETTAKFTETTATFNGVKSMVTSGGYADYYVFCSKSELEEEGATDTWILPKNTPGYKFENSKWNGLGMRGNVSCPMIIENLVLDKKYRIGEPGFASKNGFGEGERYFVMGLAAVYTGVAIAALNDTIEHAVNRKYPSGQSLADIETVQVHIANMYNQTQAAIAYINEATRAYNEKEDDEFTKILSARAFASDVAVEVTRLGMKIGGGRAYNKEGNLERYLRDSYAGQVMAPSVDVLKVWTGKLLTGIPLF